MVQIIATQTAFNSTCYGNSRKLHRKAMLIATQAKTLSADLSSSLFYQHHALLSDKLLLLLHCVP